MAEYENTIKTTVELDSVQAQRDLVKLNAIASDSTKSVQERIEAKNKAVKIQNELSAQSIKRVEEEIKAAEERGATTEEVIKLQEKLNKELIKSDKVAAQNQKAVNSLNKAYAKQEESSFSVGDSIVAMRRRLSDLTKAYDSASAAGREDMLPAIVDLKEELDEAVEASKRFQHNVGNYPTDMGRAADATDKMSAASKDSSSAFKAVDGSMGGLLSSMKAFLLNPIGAVITALVVIFQTFKKAINSTEDGAASFNAIMSGLGQIFTNLINLLSKALQPILDWLIKAITDYLNPAFQVLGEYTEAAKAAFKGFIDLLILSLAPIKALIAGILAAKAAIEGNFGEAKEIMKDFAKETAETAVSMVDNFVTAGEEIVETTKDIGEAWDDAKESASGLIGEAAKIELIQNALNKSKRDQLLIDAELNVKSKEALRNVKDLEQSFADRQAALNEFVEVERERSGLTKEILDQEVELLERRRDLSGNTKEDEEEYNNLLVERINLNASLADQERLFLSQKKTLDAEIRKAEKEELAAINEAKKESIEIDKRNLEAQFELDQNDIERRRAKGEQVLQLELDILNRKREQELSNTELLEKERQAIIEKYADESVRIKQAETEAKKAAEKSAAENSISAAAEVFGVSKEVALAQMIMAAPQAIGQSFKKAAEVAPPPLSLALGALGAAGTVAPIIKGISEIRKAKGPKGSGSAAAAPTGGAVTSITSVAANNAARTGIDPSIAQNATQTASAEATAGKSANVVFSEDSYQDFQRQVAFKEDKTTF